MARRHDDRIQPVTLRYRSSKGKTVPYTPDIHARFFPGSSDLFGHENCIVEVKYQEDLDVNGAEYEERFEVARQWADERGMKFLVLTETEIRTPLLDNALLLGPTLSFPNRNEELVSRIKAIVCCAKGCTIKHVIDQIGGEQSLTRRHIFHLIHRGVLYVEDYRQLITEQSFIRGTFEDLYHD